MGAIIDDYLGGKLEFEEAWENENGVILRLPNGAYCHGKGQPIQSEKELKAVLDGRTPQMQQELRKALDWFANKDKVVEGPSRMIVNKPDGSFAWTDGEAITDWEDVLSYYHNRIPQDFVLWWADEVRRRNALSAETAQEIGEIAKKVGRPAKAA